jgi:hypothetical protein
LLFLVVVVIVVVDNGNDDDDFVVVVVVVVDDDDDDDDDDDADDDDNDDDDEDDDVIMIIDVYEDGYDNDDVEIMELSIIFYNSCNTAHKMSVNVITYSKKRKPPECGLGFGTEIM